MRMRAEERAALVAALDAEYQTAEDAAQAAWDAVILALRDRNSYGVKAIVGPTLILAYGPLWDLRDAKKFAGLVAGSVHNLSSPAGAERAVESKGKT